METIESEYEFESSRKFSLDERESRPMSKEIGKVDEHLYEHS
jgi:hypothetical protein